MAIHLYHMPIPKMEEVYSEYGKQTYLLRNQNRTAVSFEKHLIASFEKLENEPEGCERYEHRVIQLDRSIERKLLEKLILQGLGEANYTYKKYYLDGRRIIQIKPLNYQKITIRRGLHLDVMVKQTGEVIVGFDLTHDFVSPLNGLDLINQNELKQGDRVFYRNKPSTYIVTEISKQKISDPLDDLDGNSIIEYFRKQGEQKIVKFLEKSPNVPIVKTKDNRGRVYSHAPQLLRKVSTTQDLDNNGFRLIKLPPSKKVVAATELFKEITQIFQKRFFPLDIDMNSTIIEKLGYKRHLIKEPKLLIGKGKFAEFRELTKKLSNFGIYDTISEPLKYRLLIDKRIIDNWKKKAADNFIYRLEEQSQKWGVILSQADSEIILDTSNVMQLRMQLKQLEFDPSCLYGVVLDETKKDGKSYEPIKQELGGNKDIHTQVILLNTIKKSAQHALDQILLGLYTKAGIQPWVLQQPLHADCYVGYDVSYDQGKHATGIVQVFGRDGSQIWSNPISSSEAGEKVSKKTIENMILEVLHQYEKKAGHLPKHIVFYRDGKGYEDELNYIREVLHSIGKPIIFDYISIRKECHRRMAYFPTSEERKRENILFKNPVGSAYISEKEQVAYLCSTDPYYSIGMAKPLKIMRLTENLTLEQIVEDVYHLSFMNIHTSRKVRLPAPVYYADLTSTFFNRGYLSNRHPERPGIGSV